MRYHIITGIGVIILKEDRVLLGQREGSHGAGTWAFPGGKQKFGESRVECALRETDEKTGLIIELISEYPVGSTEDFFNEEKRAEGNLKIPEPGHYSSLYMLGRHISGEPRVREKSKCLRWGWSRWEEFPEPLFPPIENLIKQGYNPFN